MSAETVKSPPTIASAHLSRMFRVEAPAIERSYDENVLVANLAKFTGQVINGERGPLRRYFEPSVVVSVEKQSFIYSLQATPETIALFDQALPKAIDGETRATVAAMFCDLFKTAGADKKNGILSAALTMNVSAKAPGNLGIADMSIAFETKIGPDFTT